MRLQKSEFERRISDYEYLYAEKETSIEECLIDIRILQQKIESLEQQKQVKRFDKELQQQKRQRTEGSEGDEEDDDSVLETENRSAKFFKILQRSSKKKEVILQAMQKFKEECEKDRGSIEKTLRKKYVNEQVLASQLLEKSHVDNS